MTEPGIEGRSTLTLLDSARRVSAVFENRAPEVLADHGIDDLATGERYPARALVRLINECDSDIDHQSVLSAGEYLRRTTPGMDDCETAVDALNWLAKLPELTY